MNTTKRTSILLLSLGLLFVTVMIILIVLLSGDAVSQSISNWRNGSDKNVLWHIENEGYADNKSGYIGFMAYVIIAMFLKVFVAIAGLLLIINAAKENNKIGIFAGVTGIIFVPLSLVFAGVTLVLNIKHVEATVQEAANNEQEIASTEESSTNTEGLNNVVVEEVKVQNDPVEKEPVAIVDAPINEEDAKPDKKSWWKVKKNKTEEVSIETSVVEEVNKEEVKPIIETKVEEPIKQAVETVATPVAEAVIAEPAKKPKVVKVKVEKPADTPKEEKIVAPSIVSETQPQVTPEVQVQPVEVQTQQQVPLEQYQDPTQQVQNGFVDSPESIQAMNELGEERTKTIQLFAADLIPKIDPNSTEEQISQAITQQLFVKQVVGYNPEKESPEQVLSMVQKVVDNVVKKFASTSGTKDNSQGLARAPQTKSQPTRRPMMTQPRRR